MGHRVCCYPSCPYITCKLDLTGVVTDLDIHGQDLKAELEVEFPFGTSKSEAMVACQKMLDCSLWD